MRSVCLAGIVFAWLLCANVAEADLISDTSALTGDNATGDLPPTDLNGWFFSLDSEPPFPTEPDPSQPWTSPANIATLNYWLSLVMELGDDPSLLTQLYGLGMISSPDPATPPVSQVSQVSQVSEVSTQEGPSDVPEPGTLGLFAGGLALLGLYAAERARRLRYETIPAAIIKYGPL